MTEKKQALKKQDNRKVKCPHCEEQLYRREAIKHANGRYYHEECYEESRSESDHYKELVNYICDDLYNIKRPTGMMLMQIKRFREEFDYKYKGMELTLRYFYEILGNKVDKDTGLGIIPYIYEKAAEQYTQSLKIRESVENFNSSEVKENTVYIDTANKNRKSKAIDIDSI